MGGQKSISEEKKREPFHIHVKELLVTITFAILAIATGYAIHHQMIPIESAAALIAIIQVRQTGSQVVKNIREERKKKEEETKNGE